MTIKQKVIRFNKSFFPEDVFKKKGDDVFLRDDFFSYPLIAVLMGEKNGSAHVRVYMALLFKLNGAGDTLPYDLKELAKLVKTEEEMVVQAIGVFTKYGLAEIVEEGAA